MFAKLSVIDGKNKGLSCPLPKENGIILVGSNDICELTLKEDPKVAKIHSCIRVSGEKYILEHRGGPKYETILQGVKIDSPVAVKSGVKFQVGDNIIGFYIEEDVDNEPHSGNPLRKTTPLSKQKRVKKDIVIGKYRVIEKIGEGSMSQVFKAVEKDTEKAVALKVLSKKAGQLPEVIQRFCREACTYAKLDHPNIIKIYDVGEHKGTLYLVLEYIHGINLGNIVSLKGPFTPKQSILLTLAACSALEYAQRKGIYHRDLKPGNMLIERETKRLKIGDMGIAKVADESGLTQPGEILGTPTYMAPEQIIDPKSADHRADIYSLGATLYFTLSGKAPFEWTTSMNVGAFMRRRLEITPPPLKKLAPQVPHQVVTLVEKAMSYKVEDRFQSYDVMTKAFKEVLTKL